MVAPVVLVVEDEAMLLDLVVAELEDGGFTVLQAMTADEALDLLASNATIDCLFTDIRLPGQSDGWQLAEKARSIRPGINIVYATGFSIETPRPMAGSMFFTKPYRPSAILAALRALASIPNKDGET